MLKLAGAGSALGALTQPSVIGAAQEDDDGSDGDDGEGGDEGTGGSHFVADWMDPTFGYPLAADETDDVDIEHAVEMYTQSGEGAHASFPRSPEQEDVPFEFAFDPVGVQVEPDDIVSFQSTGGEHTATAFHEKYSNPEIAIPTRIPDEIPGFTSPPIVDGESWLYQFPTKGVYDILCLPHYALGMVMRVVVFDPDEDDIEDVTFAAPTAGDLSANVDAVLSSEELDPANIVDAGTVAWEELTIEVEGTGDEADGEGSDDEETEDGEETESVTVQVREHEELGEILVDAEGMTLYLFAPDESADGSSCQESCAATWSPLTVDGEPAAGDDVTAELTTFERADSGEMQVTANDWPLYTYTQDEAPGDANGQAVEDAWWTVRPDGTATRDSSG